MEQRWNHEQRQLLKLHALSSSSATYQFYVLESTEYFSVRIDASDAVQIELKQDTTDSGQIIMVGNKDNVLDLTLLHNSNAYDAIRIENSKVSIHKGDTPLLTVENVAAINTGVKQNVTFRFIGKGSLKHGIKSNAPILDYSESTRDDKKAGQTRINYSDTKINDLDPHSFTGLNRQSELICKDTGQPERKCINGPLRLGGLEKAKGGHHWIGNNQSSNHVEIPEANKGVNVLIGGPEKDTFKGAAGKEYFEGRGGADVLAGGKGSDTYILNEDIANQLASESSAPVIIEDKQSNSSESSDINTLVIRCSAALQPESLNSCNGATLKEHRYVVGATN